MRRRIPTTKTLPRRTRPPYTELIISNGETLYHRVHPSILAMTQKSITWTKTQKKHSLITGAPKKRENVGQKCAPRIFINKNIAAPIRAPGLRSSGKTSCTWCQDTPLSTREERGEKKGETENQESPKTHGGGPAHRRGAATEESPRVPTGTTHSGGPPKPHAEGAKEPPRPPLPHSPEDSKGLPRAPLTPRNSPSPNAEGTKGAPRPPNQGVTTGAPRAPTPGSSPEPNAEGTTYSGGTPKLHAEGTKEPPRPPRPPSQEDTTGTQRAPPTRGARRSLPLKAPRARRDHHGPPAQNMRRKVPAMRNTPGDLRVSAAPGSRH